MDLKTTGKRDTCVESQIWRMMKQMFQQQGNPVNTELTNTICVYMCVCVPLWRGNIRSAFLVNLCLLSAPQSERFYQKSKATGGGAEMGSPVGELLRLWFQITFSISTPDVKKPKKDILQASLFSSRSDFFLPCATVTESFHQWESCVYWPHKQHSVPGTKIAYSH